jgi:SAM-dependent methyltransferase
MNTAEPGAAGPDAPAAQEQITAYWDFRSPAYDGEPGHAVQSEPERRAWLAALSDLLPAAPAEIVDAGTGTGFVALLLAELGHRVTGIDLSEGMLAVARQKVSGLPPTAPTPDFRTGDAIAPPLPPASVDAVISRHLLWTLTDLEGAFANWRRLLRPGGRVVAIDGLWNVTRQERQQAAAARPPAAPWREEWARRYTAAVQARLPLFAAETLDPVVAAARAAGFADVAISNLKDVERAERERPTDRGTSQPRYVVTARLG